MLPTTSRRALSAALIGPLVLGLVAAPGAAADRGSVRFLGEQVVPFGLDFSGTTVGGLSSIDYDPRTGEYALISDDRSGIAPARFYTARIPVTRRGLGPVSFTGTHPFLRPDGTPYPPLAADDPALPQNARTVDPEELRVDPWTGDYFWSQEGERSAALIDPSIRQATRDGRHVRDLPIPANERMVPGSGPRHNGVLEGMTFAGLGTLVVSALERPLLQDGPDPTIERGALTRVTVQTRAGRVMAQYAYPLEKVFATPTPPTAFADNGVSALLAADPADPTRYLAVERSYVTGVGNKIRIFEFDVRGATDVLGVPSLAAAPDVAPVRKRLVADLADFPVSTVDNVEGITWGPRLPGGERTLLLVSDNNFSATQVTQVIALAVR